MAHKLLVFHALNRRFLEFDVKTDDFLSFCQLIVNGFVEQTHDFFLRNEGIVALINEEGVIKNYRESLPIRIGSYGGFLMTLRGNVIFTSLNDEGDDWVGLSKEQVDAIKKYYTED